MCMSDKHQAPQGRVELVKRLGQLVPLLKGNVYPVDYDTIKTAHTKFLTTRTDEDLRGYVKNQLAPELNSLRGIARVGELYQRDPGRTLIQSAINCLDDIIQDIMQS